MEEHLRSSGEARVREEIRPDIPVRGFRVIVALDDTDAVDTPGTGHLAEELRGVLEDAIPGLTTRFVTRHQLLVHPEVPYTSHNSAMAFEALFPDTPRSDPLPRIEAAAIDLVRRRAVSGSDPGLALFPVVTAGGAHPLDAAEAGIDGEPPEDVAVADLVLFGRRAQRALATQTEARDIAARHGVRLHGLGGSNDGVIGALAAVGLRLSGNDGRVRGGVDLAAGTYRVAALVEHPEIDAVASVEPEEGVSSRVFELAPNTEVRVGTEDAKIKTIYRDYRAVLPVRRAPAGSGGWVNVSRQEIKEYLG